MTKYKIDEIVKGKVTGIKSYGIFVALGEKNNGMIHISEVSKNYVRDINDFLEVGDEVFVKVLGKGLKVNNYKLSIKELNFKSGGKNHIEEEGQGFKLLENNLDIWINSKLNEINTNKCD